MKRFWIRRILGFIILAIAGVFIFGSLVMLLWNALLPVLFHFPVITFWQGLGLLLLIKILFGGFRGGHGRGRGGMWGGNKHELRAKWMNMTPEEKEKMKEELKNRCGGRWFKEKMPAE
jgi:hypothetical protein